MKGKQLEVKLERLRKVMEAKKLLVMLGISEKGIVVLSVQDIKYSQVLTNDDDDEYEYEGVKKRIVTKFKHKQNYFG